MSVSSDIILAICTHKLYYNSSEFVCIFTRSVSKDDEMFMHAAAAVLSLCAAGSECMKYVTVAVSAGKFVFLWRLVAACLALTWKVKLFLPSFVRQYIYSG